MEEAWPGVEAGGLEAISGRREQWLREPLEKGSRESKDPKVQVGFESTYFSTLPTPPPFQDLPREEGDETTNDVPRIQCEDGCDPQGLRDNSQVQRRGWPPGKGDRRQSWAPW